jgi:hypothetical protein
MIPQVFNGHTVWVAHCGAPGCHATCPSRPTDTRRKAEERANGRGWKFTATPLCPLHARQYAPGKETR